MSGRRLVVILNYLLCIAHASFVLQVAYNDEMCFVLRAPLNSLVSGNFDCLDDNLSPIPVTVKLLNDKMDALYVSKKGSPEETFSTPAEGRLNICVQNGVTHKSEDELDRSVGLEIRVVPNVVGDNTTREFLAATQALETKLWDLMTHHDYMRNREAAHRAVTEQTFSNVMRWTILEFITLVVIAVGQVLYLRKFFEKRRFV